MTKRTLFFILIFTVLSGISSAQEIGAGASGAYNFQNKGFAYGIRVHYQITPRWAIVPQYTRYISSNPVFESYMGANLHFTLTLDAPRIYLIGGLAYDNWYNYTDYHNSRSKQNNLAEEVGAGLQFGKCCFHPFVEFRYNANWGEGAVHLGFVYFFGNCCDNKKSGRSGKSNRNHCPTYN